MHSMGGVSLRGGFGRASMRHHVCGVIRGRPAVQGCTHAPDSGGRACCPVRDSASLTMPDSARSSMSGRIVSADGEHHLLKLAVHDPVSYANGRRLKHVQAQPCWIDAYTVRWLAPPDRERLGSRGVCHAMRCSPVRVAWPYMSGEMTERGRASGSLARRTLVGEGNRRPTHSSTQSRVVVLSCFGTVQVPGQSVALRWESEDGVVHAPRTRKEAEEPRHRHVIASPPWDASQPVPDEDSATSTIEVSVAPRARGCMVVRGRRPWPARIRVCLGGGAPAWRDGGSLGAGFLGLLRRGGLGTSSSAPPPPPSLVCDPVRSWCGAQRPPRTRRCATSSLG